MKCATGFASADVALELDVKRALAEPVAHSIQAVSSVRSVATAAATGTQINGGVAMVKYATGFASANVVLELDVRNALAEPVAHSIQAVNSLRPVAIAATTGLEINARN